MGVGLSQLGRVRWGVGSYLTSPFQGWSPSHFPFPCLPPQNILNISNSNYYPITVTQLTIEVLHLSLVVGQVTNSLLLHVGPLASEQVTPSPRPALPTGVWTRVVVRRRRWGWGSPYMPLVDRCFMQWPTKSGMKTHSKYPLVSSALALSPAGNPGFIPTRFPD